MSQSIKNTPAMQKKKKKHTEEMWIRSLGREDPLEEETATHSSNLDWKIPWTEEPGRLQPMQLPRVTQACIDQQGEHCLYQPALWLDVARD